MGSSSKVGPTLKNRYQNPVIFGTFGIISLHMKAKKCDTVRNFTWEKSSACAKAMLPTSTVCTVLSEEVLLLEVFHVFMQKLAGKMKLTLLRQQLATPVDWSTPRSTSFHRWS